MIKKLTATCNFSNNVSLADAIVKISPCECLLEALRSEIRDLRPEWEVRRSGIHATLISVLWLIGTVESPHELLDKYKIEHSGISAVPFVYPLVN